MNEFLKTRLQVDQATQYLKDNGLQESGLSCKNWEAVQVILYMADGDWLDMGSDGGIVLDNLLRKGIIGSKIGIDLAYYSRDIDFDIFFHKGMQLLKRDLMDTGFNDKEFDFITCLSVIEHEVDFYKFAKECSRLLKVGGKLYCSFDFWNPKPAYEKRKLYNLDWNILDKDDVINLVSEFSQNGLVLTSEIDWSTQDAVINDTYCSPVKGVSYTFSILEFIKK